VKQHVGHAVVGHDEAKSLGNVEPFDGARHLDYIEFILGNGGAICINASLPAGFARPAAGIVPLR
jgi:hypothetical protein